MILASLALTTSTNLVVVTSAQVVLAALIVVASIHVSRRLHDAVPSTIRSGVASGAGSISWIAVPPHRAGLRRGQHRARGPRRGLDVHRPHRLAATLLTTLSITHRQRPTAAADPRLVGSQAAAHP